MLTRELPSYSGLVIVVLEGAKHGAGFWGTKPSPILPSRELWESALWMSSVRRHAHGCSSGRDATELW